MIRDLIRLVPAGQRRLLPRYFTAVVVMAVAQGLAYAALAPLLTAVFSARFGDAWKWTVGVGVALVVVAVCSYLQAMIGIRIGTVMMRDQRARLGDHLGALPLGWFSRATAGRASRVIISSTDETFRVFAHLVTPLISAVLVPVTVAVAMLWVDWRISLAMVLTAPVLYLVNRAGNVLFGRATEAQHDAAARANDQVIEFAQAQSVLRVFGGDASHERQLMGSLRDLRSAIRRALWASVPGLAVFSIVVQLTFLLLVWVIVALASDGALAVPTAIALFAVGSRFVEPLDKAAEMSTAIRRAKVAAGRVTALLDTPATAEPEVPAVPADAGVEFEGVRFAYRDDASPAATPGAPGAAASPTDHDDDAVIRGVDLTAPAGTTTAIVGPSGSGKTTMLRLAARFYEPQSGSIRLGGRDLRELGTETVLASVSLVFQDVYLFDQSVLENIRVGRPDATDAEVMAAARSARVDEIVERLPDGWHTRVGEGGAALSGGERQRVSVARALLKDAPVVLLDEATSALDPQNEAAVVQGIRELTRGRTVLVVAHRLPTIRHADQIVFLDAGRVVERGTHDELLAAGGRYADFWNQRSRASGWRLEPAAS